MPELPELIQEAERQLTVCNACRYCEGYCAVFPAMELRTAFTSGDVSYLANLCHDCRACHQACMYTAPHEFAINLPKALAEVRAGTFARYAWPRRVAGWMRRGAAGPVVAAAGVLMALLAVWVTGGGPGFGSPHTGPGAFYRVVPYLAMALPSLALSIFFVTVVWGGVVLLVREAQGSPRGLGDPRAWAGALRDALSLHQLGGGGEGCYYPDRDRPSSARRVLHSLVFYGFGAAFLSTVVAAFEQDILHQEPPYPVLSVCVLLGIAGGVGMIAGCCGLLWLKARADRSLGADAMRRMDVAFLVTLEGAAITGMLTLILRTTPLLGTMLVLHIGVLTALYVTAPYGKLVHGVYRLGALLLHRIEEQEGHRIRP
jgi:citrate/tricarballylate utilization protein